MYTRNFWRIEGRPNRGRSRPHSLPLMMQTEKWTINIFLSEQSVPVCPCWWCAHCCAVSGSFAVVLIVILPFTIQIYAYTCIYMQNTDDKKVWYHWCTIYMHILPNTCIYMQIHAIQPDLFQRICTYLHVFGVSICKYLCQYLQVLQVFASIQEAQNC